MAILSGFPESIEEESFRSGDRLLFGIESHHGSEVTRFYLLFEHVSEAELPEKQALVLKRHDREGRVKRARELRSRQRSLCLRLYDESHTLLVDSRGEISQLAHEIGLFGFAMRSRGRHGKRPKGSTGPRTWSPIYLRTPVWGSAIFALYLDEFLAADATSELASRLSIFPGLLELPRFLGGSMQLYTGITRPRIVPQPIPELRGAPEAFEIQGSLWDSGGQILGARLVLVPPLGPLALSGGVVCITVYRRYEPERYVVFRLLSMAQGTAARQGPPRN